MHINETLSCSELLTCYKDVATITEFDRSDLRSSDSLPLCSKSQKRLGLG